MSPSAPVVRNVFRACVVTAVRESEVLMVQLIEATRTALISEEAETRNVVQRDTASDALRLLGQHEVGLVKAYPMALLEIFAEGPVSTKTRQTDPTGMDFGELSLVDDAQVQAQVELSRAQQVALHATDVSLTELNALVSSAQGLQRVQPERNPLRPENYIRALQQVVTETGVPTPVREAWMQHMRALLGPQLITVYQRAAQELREHGIEPVGYGVVPLAGAGGRSGSPAEAASYGGAYADSVQGSYGPGHGPGYGALPVYGRAGGASNWTGDPGMDAGVQEALLTVDILRQMLAGGGDPYDTARSGQVTSGPLPVGARSSVWATPYGAIPSAHVGQVGGHYPVAVAEALEDINHLERLVGRLAQTQPEQVSRSALLGAQRSIYGALYAGAAESSSAAGAEVVARMVENIAQDSRLLPPVQRAVQDLEPAICQLVRHDPRFFSDSNHPARRLLDELTQRSLAFTAEDAPGFSRFMRLTNEVVSHLTGLEITSAAPFEAVLKALQTAWAAQEKKLQALRQAQEEQLLQTEQRQMLAEKIATGIRALAGVAQVPPDVMDFAAGPWADVVALAQTSDVGKSMDDPGGYVALVSDLFWSVQPDLARADPARLKALIPVLLETLRTGLHSIDYPQAGSSAFLARLVALHRPLLAAPEKPRAAPPSAAPAAPISAQPQPLAVAAMPMPMPVDGVLAPEQQLPEMETKFVVGAWIELTTNRRKVRTQLTWASPHHTLFLFTAADGSTQSMTRRMRDKLAAEGTLRVISAQPVVARAIDALGASTQATSSTGSKRRAPPTND
ncbi:DUF1631 family protein [Simplicispira psychrophila]|uniref:DUF1631 family protein n=1 Tax=Simplicispira psychrophila TaxID=80882 RepID=UPI000A04DA19|nr:DUF1631 family protein [Simplicispira psychrophila]